MKIIVKKLGGENAAELYKSSLNILEDNKQGKKQIIVVSAIRSPQVNTTDHLIEIGQQLGQSIIDKKEVWRIVDILHDFHLYIAQEKLSIHGIDISEFVEELFEQFKGKIEFYMNLLDSELKPSSHNDYSLQDKNGDVFSLVGFGELLSSQILSKVISEVSKDSVKGKNIDLSHILKPHETDKKSDREIFKSLEDKIFLAANLELENGNIPIIGGYIGVFSEGIENTMGRGYTDATAAICIVGFAHKGYEGILEIQKSVKGVLSADPRILYKPESARLITELDYVTAREITGDSGANAKLLHSQAIREEVQEAGVKIHLFDPFRTTRRSGTWVVPALKEGGEGDIGRLFIGGRKNIIFFSISSAKMFQPGLLANIFNTVKEYFSVDIISASETEVAFTIDGTKDIQKKLDKMEEELRMICNIRENTHMEFVEYTTDMALVFCIGQHMRNHIGLLAKASNVLSKNDINIEIVSQGRLQRAMVFGIEGRHMQKAINVLHEEFVDNIS
ncbi:hypothetical protein LR010_00360 [Candidatus Gracilibacteria bacterium]|nr:hypothetical protein [Candidatus Gracilibacteria bacterium]